MLDVHDIATRNKSADQPTQLSKDNYGCLVTDILIKIIVIHRDIMTNGYWGKWVQFSQYDARWKFFFSDLAAKYWKEFTLKVYY